MTKSKNEKTFLILSILLLVLMIGTYLIFSGNKTTSVGDTLVNQTKQSSSDSDNNTQAIKKAKAAVKNLINDLTQENLVKAQEAVAKLKDGNDKDKLQQKIDELSNQLNNQTAAETAVTTAETSLTATDIDAAQEAIDQLGDSDKKTELQTRLNTLAQTLNYQIGTANAVVNEAPATEVTPSSSEVAPQTESTVSSTPIQSDVPTVTPNTSTPVTGTQPNTTTPTQ